MTSHRPPTYLQGALVGLFIGLALFFASTLAFIVVAAAAKIVGWEFTVFAASAGVAVALVFTFRQRRLWRQHAEIDTSRDDG